MDGAGAPALGLPPRSPRPSAGSWLGSGAAGISTCCTAEPAQREPVSSAGWWPLPGGPGQGTSQSPCHLGACCGLCPLCPEPVGRGLWQRGLEGRWLNLPPSLLSLETLTGLGVGPGVEGEMGTWQAPGSPGEQAWWLKRECAGTTPQKKRKVGTCRAWHRGEGVRGGCPAQGARLWVSGEGLGGCADAGCVPGFPGTGAVCERAGG